MNRILIALILALGLVSCKKSGDDLQGTKSEYNLSSTIVNDNFKIFTYLPTDYSSSNQYPVIFLLDGDWYFEDFTKEFSDSTEHYHANKTMIHIYVPNVFKTFDKAIEMGCEIIEEPINKQGDPDTRGAFYDFAGNYWSVSTQINQYT